MRLIYTFISCLWIFHNSRQSIIVYVVPTLEDIVDQDGTLDSPFSSIIHARDYLRRYPFTSMRRIALYPTYHFLHTQSLIFDYHDSFTMFIGMTDKEKQSISKERKRDLIELDVPTISGGIQLKNWINDHGIWKTTVPCRLSVITQLFVNGLRANRGRSPMHGYYTYDKGLDNRTELAYRGFVYREHQFDNITLSTTSPTEFVIYHSFTTSRHYIAEIFNYNRTIIFSNPSLSVIGNTSISKQSGQRFHLENVYESMLIQENTFYFDSDSQILFYHPRSNETIMNTTIILPILETIINFIDVQSVELHSVAIEHSAWLTTSFNRTNPIDGRAAADYLDQHNNAIYMKNVTEIYLNDVRITHTGGYGIQIDRKSRNLTIENCELTDLGAGGLRTGIGNFEEVLEYDFVENISIQNCHLFDGGHLFPMGVPILVQRGTKNHWIKYNTIHSFFHTGLHIGWSWSYEQSFCSDHEISFNYIYDLGQKVLNDLGGIYTCGVLDRTIIENNVIHNIYGYHLLDWGVYLADGTSQLMLKNTIIYNTGSASLTLIYGFNNTFENNILARSSAQSDGALSLYRREALDHLSFTFHHNIVYDLVDDSGRWIFQVQAPDPFSAPLLIMDYNCYFNIYGSLLIFGLGRLIFSEWQETNHDMNSFITDPLFVNATDCDFFQLHSDSPVVTRLGFRPIRKLSQWKSGC